MMIDTRHHRLRDGDRGSTSTFADHALSRQASRPLRVAINAQLSGSGAAGGVQQAVAGLVYGLGRLQDGDEEFIVVCSPGKREWLADLIGPNTRLFDRPLSSVDRAAVGVGRLGILRPALPAAQFVWRNAVLRYREWSRRRQQAQIVSANALKSATGIYEQLGADVVDFPYQTMERVNLPCIFTPWDFQHEHHPEFFTNAGMTRRRSVYPAACRHASAVVAGTPSVRRDIHRFTGIAENKVFITPWGNPIELAPPPSEESLREIGARFHLPHEFALYPAQTFPHKNHIRLLHALAQLRDERGLIVNLVCTGRTNDHFLEVQSEMVRLRLEEQVRFVGFVEDSYLRAFYRLATFVVFPSLFEGWGFPPLEALSEGVALACSRIQPVNDHVGDAALLFDPTSVDSIAEAVGKLSTDRELRAMLRRRGSERSKKHSWEACARSHRALYRYLGGMPLTEEDRELLAASQPDVAPELKTVGLERCPQVFSEAN